MRQPVGAPIKPLMDNVLLRKLLRRWHGTDRDGLIANYDIRSPKIFGDNRSKIIGPLLVYSGKQLIRSWVAPSQSCDDIDVEQFSRFFAVKVARVCQSTENSPPPTYTSVPDGVNFSAFSAVTTDDVISVIGRLPDKSSAADLIPTPVLKAISNLVSPIIVELFNRSFDTGQFPTEFKHANR